MKKIYEANFNNVIRFPVERTSAHRDPLIANLYALMKSGLIGQDQYNRKIKELRGSPK